MSAGARRRSTVFSKFPRVSPAMGVALVALAFAVSGTSFAQGAATRVGRLISGSSIKRGSITGNRIRSNSLTGKQIDEKSLATVPSAAVAKRAQTADRATNAQRATNADNALTLGGTAAAGFLTYASQAIPSGATVTGAFGFAGTVTVTDLTATATATGNDMAQVVSLPGTAPADLTDATVNFAPTPAATDGDPACAGNITAPTAPAGKVCLYIASAAGTGTTVEGLALPGSRAGFVVHAVSAAASAATGVFGVWAYTAP
jgi:hypothetical protein